MPRSPHRLLEPRAVASGGSLKQAQLWLQRAILSPAAPSTAAKHIAPSATLTPAERLAIYRDLYPARMVHALKVDYPLLHQYLGGPLFTQLALLYAQAHPSRSFTLNAFGIALPHFIAKIQGLRRPDFAVDLALFEQTCAEVFHETEAPPLTAEAIAAVPHEAWERVRLVTIPALRLLRLRYPVWKRAQSELDEGERQIRRQPSFVAIYRNNYDVVWLPLSARAFAVLTSLSRGSTLGKSLSAARGPVQTWFRDWVAAGLFAAVQIQKR